MNKKAASLLREAAITFFVEDNSSTRIFSHYSHSGLVLAPYRLRQVAVASSGHFPQQLFMSITVVYICGG